MNRRDFIKSLAVVPFISLSDTVKTDKVICEREVLQVQEINSITNTEIRYNIKGISENSIKALVDNQYYDTDYCLGEEIHNNSINLKEYFKKVLPSNAFQEIFEGENYAFYPEYFSFEDKEICLISVSL